jgi:hypothetical protein
MICSHCAVAQQGILQGKATRVGSIEGSVCKVWNMSFRGLSDFNGTYVRRSEAPTTEFQRYNHYTTQVT